MKGGLSVINAVLVRDFQWISASIGGKCPNMVGDNLIWQGTPHEGGNDIINNDDVTETFKSYIRETPVIPRYTKHLKIQSVTIACWSSGKGIMVYFYKEIK